MPIFDGQAVDAAVTNPVFLDKTQDDTKVGKLALHDPSSANVDDVQLRLNKTKTATNDGSTTYTSQKRITNGDTYPTALGELDSAFHETTGHKHGGTAGDGPLLPTTSLAGNPLRGFAIQGTTLTTITGGSTPVTTQLTGQHPSSGSSDEGVVVTAPNNRVILRNSVDDTDFVDATGNLVYGRVTYSGGIWTLTFYSEIAGVETAYTFASAVGIKWYYQKLYNPLTDAPVYSDLFAIPSDNATSDVIEATTTLEGKVKLGNAAPADIASAGAAGTANARVANADHTHKGVGSFAKTLGTLRYGAISLTEGTNITITDNGDGTYTLNSSAVAAANPTALSASTAGFSTSSTSAVDVVSCPSMQATGGKVKVGLAPVQDASNQGQILVAASASVALLQATFLLERSDNGGGFAIIGQIFIANAFASSSGSWTFSHAPGAIYFEDTSPYTGAGGSVYKLRALVSANTTLHVTNCVLSAYQLT